MASGTLFCLVWLQWSTDAPDSDGETCTGARTWRMSCLVQSYDDCKPETSLGPLWLSNEMTSRGEERYLRLRCCHDASLSWDSLCPATSEVDDKVMTRVNARSLRYASLFLVGAPPRSGAARERFSDSPDVSTIPWLLGTASTNQHRPATSLAGGDAGWSRMKQLHLYSAAEKRVGKWVESCGSTH